MRWAREKWGVEYTYGGMRWVFARLGLRKKVPRPRCPQASEAEQEAWKKGANAAATGGGMDGGPRDILE